MGIIKDFIFGKEVIFRDKKMGDFKTKIRSNNPSKTYIWVSEQKLYQQLDRTTVIFVEGDFREPNEGRLIGVYKIIDKLDDIVNKLDIWFKEQQNVDPKFKEVWTNKFYLDTIEISKVDKRELVMQFDLCFDTISTEASGYIFLTWEDGRIVDVSSEWDY